MTYRIYADHDASETLTRPNVQTIFATHIAGFAITLMQSTNAQRQFAVRYGKQVDHHLSYSEACQKLGEAIMHASACEGLIIETA